MPIRDIHDAYYIQESVVRNLLNVDRKEFIKAIVAEQRVVHIGCVGTTARAGNTPPLHLQLAPRCKRLVGVDINEDGLRGLLSKDPTLELYSSISRVPADYFDMLLVPEVLEHVDDAGQFLADLSRLNFGIGIITVPCAYRAALKQSFEYDLLTSRFTEVVHPDHNCWFSPYTLQNLISKTTPWRVESLHFLAGVSLMAIVRPR